MNWGNYPKQNSQSGRGHMKRGKRPLRAFTCGVCAVHLSLFDFQAITSSSTKSGVQIMCSTKQGSAESESCKRERNWKTADSRHIGGGLVVEVGNQRRKSVSEKSVDKREFFVGEEFRTQVISHGMKNVQRIIGCTGTISLCNTCI